MTTTKPKYQSLMSAGVALLIFGVLGIIAPALTEIGMGMSAAGVFFCLGAFAGLKKGKRAMWAFVITGIIAGLALAVRIVDNPSQRRSMGTIILSAPSAQ